MQRKRLTITLRTDLLAAIDSYIDGISVRNRSHAIEFLLGRELHPPITRAVILAADQGIQFRPFTYEMPKAMLPVRGRPLLEHVIAQLRDHDIRELYISVGYLSDKIKSYFGDGSKFGVNIIYSTQSKKDLGTGGALRNFRKYFKAQAAFFLIYGDVLADINYHDMVEFYYKRQNAFSVAALTTVSNPELWGVVAIKGHNIVEFTEKPKKGARSHLVSAGIYIFDNRIFPHIPHGTKVSLERQILPKLVKEHKVSGYIMEGDWYDISTPEAYEEALQALN